MSDNTDLQTTPPHIALFPSSGMGHLNPFLRLAAMLASRNCTVTLITVQPTISAAESTHISRFLSTHPHIKRLEFQILPFNPSNPTTDDPFCLQVEAIIRSTHLLRPLLSSSSPPLSAIFSDITVTTSVTQISADLCIPNYIVSTTSARFFSLVAYLPLLISETATKISSGGFGEVRIPGLAPLPESSIPPPVFNPNHLFTAQMISNARSFPEAKGIIMNTFDWFEPETITALNNGRVLSNLPPVHPVGPLEPYNLEKGQHLAWLDDQPTESVVYVSFGSRTALSKDQIREIGNGLESSRCKFLWVIKSSIVDKEDKEELKELLGDSFLERMKNKGMVVKGWVNQQAVLAHPAIGGFISHCGWNLVMEAASQGIPMLAWPQNGDQRVNAEVVETVGLGIWERSWGWAGERMVKGEEVGERVGKMMGDEQLRQSARKVGEEARRAVGVGGSSEKELMGVIEMLKQKMRN